MDQNVFKNLLSVLRRRKKSIFEKLLLRFVCLLVDQNLLKILISVLRERKNYKKNFFFDLASTSSKVSLFVYMQIRRLPEFF